MMLTPQREVAMVSTAAKLQFHDDSRRSSILTKPMMGVAMTTFVVMFSLLIRNAYEKIMEAIGAS